MLVLSGCGNNTSQKNKDNKETKTEQNNNSGNIFEKMDTLYYKNKNDDLMIDEKDQKLNDQDIQKLGFDFNISVTTKSGKLDTGEKAHVIYTFKNESKQEYNINPGIYIVHGLDDNKITNFKSTFKGLKLASTGALDKSDVDSMIVKPNHTETVEFDIPVKLRSYPFGDYDDKMGEKFFDISVTFSNDKDQYALFSQKQHMKIGKVEEE